jgi:hypothetical protein
MPSLDWAKDWTERRAEESNPPVIAYEKRFGPVPQGLYKVSTMLTINTVSSLNAAMREALRAGVPITDWTPFRTPLRRATGASPSDKSSRASD